MNAWHARYSSLFESVDGVSVGFGMAAALLSTTLTDTAESTSVINSEITSKRNLQGNEDNAAHRF